MSGTEAGRSILLMPKAHLSRAGLEEGEGRGCEPVMKTDSERGVWFPPRPLEGGTPTSLALWSLSAAAMVDSTSSMTMRMFSGLRSV